MYEDIKLVKLVNGEQVVARVGVDSQNNYVLDKAVVLVQVGPGQIGMRPWLLGGDFTRSVTINRDHVIVDTPCDPELAREYYEKYHGGVAIATPEQVAALNSELILDQQ